MRHNLVEEDSSYRGRNNEKATNRSTEDDMFNQDQGVNNIKVDSSQSFNTDMQQWGILSSTIGVILYEMGKATLAPPPYCAPIT